MSSEALMQLVEAKVRWVAGDASAGGCHDAPFAGPNVLDARKVMDLITGGRVSHSADASKRDRYAALLELSKGGVMLDAVGTLRRAFPLANEEWAAAMMAQIVYARVFAMTLAQWRKALGSGGQFRGGNDGLARVLLQDIEAIAAAAAVSATGDESATADPHCIVEAIYVGSSDGTAHKRAEQDVSAGKRDAQQSLVIFLHSLCQPTVLVLMSTVALSPDEAQLAECLVADIMKGPWHTVNTVQAGSFGVEHEPPPPEVLQLAPQAAPGSGHAGASGNSSAPAASSSSTESLAVPAIIVHVKAEPRNIQRDLSLLGSPNTTIGLPRRHLPAMRTLRARLHSDPAAAQWAAGEDEDLLPVRNTLSAGKEAGADVLPAGEDADMLRAGDKLPPPGEEASGDMLPAGEDADMLPAGEDADMLLASDDANSALEFVEGEEDGEEEPPLEHDAEMIEARLAVQYLVKRAHDSGLILVTDDDYLLRALMERVVKCQGVRFSDGEGLVFGPCESPRLKVAPLTMQALRSNATVLEVGRRLVVIPTLPLRRRHGPKGFGVQALPVEVDYAIIQTLQARLCMAAWLALGGGQSEGLEAVAVLSQQYSNITRTFRPRIITSLDESAWASRAPVVDLAAKRVLKVKLHDVYEARDRGTSFLTIQMTELEPDVKDLAWTHAALRLQHADHDEDGVATSIHIFGRNASPGQGKAEPDKWGTSVHLLARVDLAGLVKTGARSASSAAVRQLLFACGQEQAAVRAIDGISRICLPLTAGMRLAATARLDPSLRERQARRVIVHASHGDEDLTVGLDPEFAVGGPVPDRANMLICSTGTGVGFFALNSPENWRVGVDNNEERDAASARSVSAGAFAPMFAARNSAARSVSMVALDWGDVTLIWEVPYLWFKWAKQVQNPSARFAAWAIERLRDMDPRLFALHFDPDVPLSKLGVAVQQERTDEYATFWASAAAHARYALNQYQPGCRSHVCPVLAGASPRISVPQVALAAPLPAAAAVEPASLSNGGRFEATLHAGRTLTIVLPIGYQLRIDVSWLIDAVANWKLLSTTPSATAALGLRMTYVAGFVELHCSNSAPLGRLPALFLFYAADHAPLLLDSNPSREWLKQELLRLVPDELLVFDLPAPSGNAKWQKLCTATKHATDARVQAMISGGRALRLDSAVAPRVAMQAFDEMDDSWLPADDCDSYTVGVTPAHAAT